MSLLAGLPCYKVSKSCWHHVCMFAAFFSSRLFNPCLSYIFIPLCSKLWYCEVEVFFFTSLPCRLITHILTAFSITFQAGVRSSCGSFQDQIFALKIENTPIKDTNGKRKFKRMLSFLFVDKRKLFVAMGLSFYCFLHGGSEGLACFESTRQRGFWRHFRYIPYSMIKEKYVFKRKFLYL